MTPETGRGRWPRWLWVVLILSLALNVFFVSGVFWARLYAPHGPRGAIGHFERVAHHLSLNASQHAAFNHFLDRLRSQRRTMHEESRALIDHAWDELAKPQPDTGVLDHIFTEAAQQRRGFMADTSAALQAFLATLTPQQRTEFIDRARRHPDRPPHRP